MSTEVASNTMASNQNNADRFGKKFDYDPQWKGPMAVNRTPTDRYWLIGFIIFFIIYFVGACYAFYFGDLKKLDTHLDGTGLTCGIDRRVANKPYVMHLNLRQNSRSSYSPKICVSQCPTENFVYDNSQPLEEIKGKLICTDDMNITSIESIDEIDMLIADDKCTRWYLKSQPVFYNCIAYNAWEGHEYETISAVQLYNRNREILDGDYYLKKIYRIFQWAWIPILVSLLCSAILTLLIVLSLRQFAEPFFYASVFLFVVLLTIAIYFMLKIYSLADGSVEQSIIAVIIIVCVIIVIAIVVSVLCSRKKIHLACLLVQESTKAVIHLPATLVYPFIAGIFEIAILAFSIMFLLCLLTITFPTYTIHSHWDDDRFGCLCNGKYYILGDRCDPDEYQKCIKLGGSCASKRCLLDNEETTPVFLYFLHAINLFGLYWLTGFTTGMEFMVLGGTFATWYWTLQKSDVRNSALIQSLSRTVRYHLGTICLGSLILTITESISAALQYGAQQSGNSGQIYMQVMSFQADMFHEIMEFLNKNAYIMCAAHGTNFFRSAKNAFNLIMRNFAKVIVVHSVADTIFLVAGLLVVSIVVGGLVAYLNVTQPSDPDERWVFWATVIVTVIGAAMVSNVFLAVVSNAVHTIFLCFIEDVERNDGSTQRPYYMSSKLQQLLQR